MDKSEVLETIARHRDSHRSMVLADAYSAQEYPRLRDAHVAVSELYSEVERLRRAIRPATTETFAADVAEYEANLAEGGAA
jgi:hypothetical protein